MIKNSLLQKYALMSVGTLAVFLLLGWFFSSWLTHTILLANQPPEFAQMKPPLALANIIADADTAHRLEIVKKWKSDDGDMSLLQMSLLDENGQVLAPAGNSIKTSEEERLRSALQELKKEPVTAQLAVREFHHGGPGLFGPGPFMRGPFDRGPGGPPPGGHGGPGGPGGFDHGSGDEGPPPPPGEEGSFDHGPGGPPPVVGDGPPPPPPMMMGMSWLVRLPGTPTQFLYLKDIKMEQMHHGSGPSKWLPIVGFGSLILSLVLGVGFATFFIYNSVQQKVRVADEVLGELQRGNFKARFPIQRSDEFGKAMMRFNKMADEIESLVSHLRFVEQARNRMLQELAHDLRTPIASLRNMLETISQRSDRLTPEVRAELLEMALRDTLYFEKLVEDLLFLSQVSEPKYQIQAEDIDLQVMISELISDAEAKARSLHKTIELQAAPSFVAIVRGDRHLIRRMISNTIQNGLDFAKTNVCLKLGNEAGAAGFIQICVEDDGQGFKTADIDSYGIRRTTRSLRQREPAAEAPGQPQRVSVGLGSVIIRTLCQLHGGKLEVGNRTDQNGKILGAVVKMLLPKI